MNAADLPTDAAATTTACGLRWRDLALAALGALLEAPADTPGDAAAPEERLLRHALARAGGAAWPAAVQAALAAPAPADAPLARARRLFGLDAAEALALALAAAVEDDPVAGRVVAWLQPPLAQPRPTLALLARALAPLADADPADPLQAEARLLHRLADGPVRRHGLALCDDRDDRPLCDSTWRVPPCVAAALAGVDGDGPSDPAPPCWQPPQPLAEVDAVLDASLTRWARDLPRLPRAGLVVRSGAAHEACGVAAEIVRRLGGRPAWFTVERGQPLPAGTAAWLALTGRVPVFRLDAAPGEIVALPALPAVDGPLLVAAGPDGGVRRDDALAASAPLADWTVPRPGPAARTRLWAQALGEAADPALAAQAAQRWRGGAAQIADQAALARLLGGGCIDDPALQQAAAMTPSARALDALALPLTDPVPDAALVTGPALRAELDRVLQRCRQRERLAGRLGVAARTRASDGVRLLFTGGSGTGKTLAGQWLAQRLGLPVWRVDLAALQSKWIGETEKHLAELLSRAEHADAVLLFDEADTLFGKRTEVQTANDRFANGQTNYLLQRIETHAGIVVLTSNARSRVDAAFVRRLDFIVDFAAPDAPARRALWLAHLGEAAALSPAELNRLAALGDIAGGQVRNAVLAAAAQAGERGTPIGYADVADGLRAELRKLGRSAPADLSP